MQAASAGSGAESLPTRRYLSMSAGWLPSERLQQVAIVSGLAAMGLVVHHGYLTAAPLASNDWTWVSGAWLHSLFPWPTVWDSSSGFGSTAFARLFSAPFEAVWGGLVRLGLDWDVLEKLFYFVPFAVLSFVGPWVLARELLGSARWAVIAAIIFATNTHVFLRGTAHLAMACAFAVGTLVFWADVRAKRGGGVPWSIITGLLLVLQATYDIRIAVLAIWCLALKVILETATARSLTDRLRYAGLFAVSLLLFASTQLSWMVPLLASGGAQLPIADAPVQAFASLGHGFTAHDPLWTGGPVAFRASDLPWLAYLTPLAAFAALTMRRIRLEYVWLLLCALVAAFLIKQNGAPAGAVYGWLFAHVPTWNLFREASKLFWIPAVAYAVLIPYVTRSVWLTLRSHRRTVLALAGAAGLLAYPLAEAVSNSIALARGDLGGATVATHFPDSFKQLEALLAADPQRSTVAFIGGAAVTDTTIHRFSMASQRHPDLELWGTTHPYDPTSADNDPLNTYCPGGGVPFCYLQPGVFPYLMRELGVGYVVAPAGGAIGSLPWGTSYQQLNSRVSNILGIHAQHLGSGSEAISLWHLEIDGAMLVSSPAIAQVAAPASATGSVLPALAALGVPALFSTGVAPGSIPDSIAVVPRRGQDYMVHEAGRYVLAVAADSKAPSSIEINGHTQSSHVVLVAHRGGSQLLGPFDLPSGSTTLDAGGVEGALISWSPITVAVLASDSPEAVLSSTDSNEAVGFSAPSSPWILMRQQYADQWRLDRSDLHVTADGMLNSYHVGGVPAGTPLEARYSLRDAQQVGIAASLLIPVVFVVPLLTMHRLRRRRGARWGRSRAAHHVIPVLGAGRFGLWMAWLGTTFVILAMGSHLLQAIGWPSPHPGATGDALTPGGSPYTDSSLYYLSFGMGFLFLAVVARIAQRSRIILASES